MHAITDSNSNDALISIDFKNFSEIFMTLLIFQLNSFKIQ